jgi:hypothetical protein
VERRRGGEEGQEGWRGGGREGKGEGAKKRGQRRGGKEYSRLLSFTSCKVFSTNAICESSSSLSSRIAVPPATKRTSFLKDSCCEEGVTDY